MRKRYLRSQAVAVRLKTVRHFERPRLRPCVAWLMYRLLKWSPLRRVIRRSPFLSALAVWALV